MKNFKRILMLLLALTVLFCFIACGDTTPECEEHVDKNVDGVCDKCKAEVEIPEEEELDLGELEEVEDEEEVLDEAAEEEPAAEETASVAE